MNQKKTRLIVSNTAGKSTSPQHQPLWWERLKFFEQETRIPLGYFCIFSELGYLMRDLEAGGYIFPDRKVPDISVGLCWCKWLRLQGINTDFPTYPHYYPDGRVVGANIYPDELLPKFRWWLYTTYVIQKLPNYVKQFCSPEEIKLITAIVQKRLSSVA
ncbi:hypothetical protein [Hydrocoleum sp. CS-953]|uniref:hypothetical protein n=1 Tax=Hydrocoleum sp. CS-953 TaxID=1671698 RepID=UPI00117AB662|nr:hypothetical protein [Hydrocoleum sp. CS-953]